MLRGHSDCWGIDPSNFGLLDLTNSESVEDESDADDAKTLAMYAGLMLNEVNEEDLHEARPEACLLDDIRETVLDVLSAEQDKMQDILLGFNIRQHEQWDAQHKLVKRTLASQQQKLEHVLESTLERCAITLDGALNFTRTEAKKWDGEESSNTVGFNVVDSDPDGIDKVPSRPEAPNDSLRTQVDMQKLKLEFSYKQAALSTLTAEKSYVMRGVDTALEAVEHIVSSVSRRRWHFDNLKTFVNGQYFRGFMVSVIILNAAYIGFVMDVTLQAALDDSASSLSPTDNDIGAWKRMIRVEHPWVLGAELFFTTTFVLEICLRILALEGEFFVGEEAGWNVFDFVLTMSTVAELGLVGMRVDLSFMRVIRITGIVRSFRVFSFLRMVPLMRSLRLMTLAIVKSIVPFVWAVLILLEVIFVFGVVIAHGVVEHIVFGEGGLSEDVRTYLGSISMTMLSLFMSISGGVDWWTIGNILLNISTGYLFLFLFFILFTVLAVLNIITGIFVKEAQEMASKDHNVQLQQELEENRQLLTSLKEIFHRMDEHNTGCVSLFDFERTMEHEDVRLRFAQVGLDIQDTTSFFKILDQDDSEELSIEEFVMGCMRFRGNPSNINMECALLETKQLLAKFMLRQKRNDEKLRMLLEGISSKLRVPSSIGVGARPGYRRSQRVVALRPFREVYEEQA
mmetsp:Transcript_44581/g.118334  ORF Transcript_44581/g.118334 Transcript_44581/m.118334 type:complete len:682 (-) Transcript_44581:31-2076(-)